MQLRSVKNPLLSYFVLNNVWQIFFCKGLLSLIFLFLIKKIRTLQWRAMAAGKPRSSTSNRRPRSCDPQRGSRNLKRRHLGSNLVSRDPSGHPTTLPAPRRPNLASPAALTGCYPSSKKLNSHEGQSENERIGKGSLERKKLVSTFDQMLKAQCLKSPLGKLNHSHPKSKRLSMWTAKVYRKILGKDKCISYFKWRRTKFTSPSKLDNKVPDN